MSEEKELAMILDKIGDNGAEAFNAWLAFRYVEHWSSLFTITLMILGLISAIFYGIKAAKED